MEIVIFIFILVASINLLFPQKILPKNEQFVKTICFVTVAFSVLFLVGMSIIFDFGGKEGKICKTSALFEKQLFENLIKYAKHYELDKDYAVTLEATHHGPLIDKPCIFIEIGATETEWNDRRAGFVVAKTIEETIKTFKENPYNEVAIAIGGPHYCPTFNKIQSNSNVAISHVIPAYALPLSDEMIKEENKQTDSCGFDST